MKKKTKKKIVLVTPAGRYDFSEFNFTEQPNMSILKKLGVSMKGSKYVNNPKEFIEKLNQDYGG